MFRIDTDMAEKVAIACNILAMEGHNELTLGHLSAKKPDEKVIYMKAGGLGLDEITVGDVILLDMEGNQLAGGGRKHQEYPIHTEIYRMYPQINCVVHTHPFYSIIIGASKETLRPINHDGILFSDLPVFKETGALIRTPEQGVEVARCLRGKRAMLMINHGVVVTGQTIEEATLNATFLEKAARMQVTASMVGRYTWSSSREVKIKEEECYSPALMQSFWNYLVRKVRKNKNFT